MNSKQFFDKVSQMREAQKMYFKTKSAQYLRESKSLEKEIDMEIERVNKIVAKKKNPQLF